MLYSKRDEAILKASVLSLRFSVHNDQKIMENLENFQKIMRLERSRNERFDTHFRRDDFS